MIRFLLGMFFGAVLAYNAASDMYDARLTGLFDPNNYPATRAPGLGMTGNSLGDPIPLHRK